MAVEKTGKRGVRIDTVGSRLWVLEGQMYLGIESMVGIPYS